MLNTFSAGRHLFTVTTTEKGGQLPEPQTCCRTHSLSLLQAVVMVPQLQVEQPHNPVVPAAWMMPLVASGGLGHPGLFLIAGDLCPIYRLQGSHCKIGRLVYDIWGTSHTTMTSKVPPIPPWHPGSLMCQEDIMPGGGERGRERLVSSSLPLLHEATS